MRTPITQIQGTIACLMAENISTDVISPSELYLKPRSAYADGLFAPWRYLGDGSKDPEFVLNRPGLENTKILVTGPNFGCGSSREIAVWCLQDYGIECVIGESFGEIFFENAFKSGLLALELPAAQVAEMVAMVEGASAPACSVDLASRQIELSSGLTIGFEMDPFRHRLYTEGLEEIDVIMSHGKDVDAFQEESRRSTPWILPVDPPSQLHSERRS